jgi:flagellar motor switch protein FliM
MINPLEDKSLNHDKLRQLIASAKKHVPAEQVQPDAAGFDWQRPHHFSSDQFAALDAFGRKLADQITKTFNALCQGDFSVTIASTSQIYACTIADTVSTEQPEHYFLPFTTADNNHCGLISISPETAPVLVGHMLRDPEIGAREDKKLSELEESILTDITIALVDVLATALMENAGPVIQKSSHLIKGKWPLDFNGFKDLTSITVTANHPDGTVEFTFTMLSDILEPVLGIKARPDQEFSAQQIRDMILQNMHDAPIKVTAQLSSASMCLSDVMNLCVGDILLLARKVDEPIEVLLNDRQTLRAYPAASFSKYAIVIAPPDTK